MQRCRSKSTIGNTEFLKGCANNLFAIGLGAAALGVTALPVMAASWTQPGATMGVPAGTVPHARPLRRS